MLRHAFIIAYDGDQTYETPASGFDLSELIQPDSGDLYPDLPADTIVVGFGSADHDLLAVELSRYERLVADGASTVAEVDAYNAAVQNIDAIRAAYAAKMAPLEADMQTWAAQLESDGFVKVGVLDV